MTNTPVGTPSTASHFGSDHGRGGTRPYLLLLLCSLAAAPLQAATEYQARVTITAIPAGLPTNITVNIGSATTRNWTNDANPTPATSIQTTNTIAASVTNAVLHFQVSPIYTGGVGTPEAIVDYDTNSPTTTFTITAPLNTNITVTFGGTWATVVYQTNVYTDAGPITWPTNGMSPRIRTNAMNSVVNLLNTAVPSNSIAPGNFALRHYTDNTSSQNVSNKTARFFAASGITSLDGYLGVLTNGIFWSNILHRAWLSNVVHLSGVLGNTTNGYNTNGAFDRPHITNGQFYGATDFIASTISLDGSGVNNMVSLTATSSIAAISALLVFNREDGIDGAVDANDVLGNIVFTGYGDTDATVGARIRAYAQETFTDSSGAASLRFETTPSGASATVVRMRIEPDGTVIIVGTNWVNQSFITNLVAYALEAGTGSLSNFLFRSLGGTNFNAHNSSSTGTNRINARLDYGPGTVTTLVNGYNSAVALGNFPIFKMSGPTLAYTNRGFVSPGSPQYVKLLFDNPVNNMTIMNEDGGEFATNRIRISTSGAAGGLRNYTNNPVSLDFWYDISVSRWLLLEALP